MNKCCSIRASLEKRTSVCDNFGWRGNTGVASLDKLQPGNAGSVKFDPKL